MVENTPSWESKPTSADANVIRGLGCCRTKVIPGILTIGECQVAMEGSCPYAVIANEIRFCRHPKWSDFLMRGAGGEIL
jgi:hypothetical protein